MVRPQVGVLMAVDTAVLAILAVQLEEEAHQAANVVQVQGPPGLLTTVLEGDLQAPAAGADMARPSAAGPNQAEPLLRMPRIVLDGPYGAPPQVGLSGLVLLQCPCIASRLGWSCTSLCTLV
jgi:hypothetical protein